MSSPDKASDSKRRRGRRALRGKVGQVHGNQLPADARRRVGRQEVHALGDAVVGQDQAVEQRRVVGEAERGGTGRNPP